MEISVLLKNSRFLLLLLLAVLVFGALYVFRAVMLPFAVAGLFAYLIAPLINRIATVRVRGRKVHRAIAIMLVYAVALSLLTLSGFFLVPKLTSEVNRLVKDLPRIMRDLEVSVVMPLDQKVGDWLKEFVPLPVPSEGTAAPEPNPPADGKTMESPPPGSESSMLRLVEDYTYVVQQLEEGRFEITAKRRGVQIQEQQEPDWDVSKQISATFGQFRTYFEQNFVELLQLSRRYILIVVSSFFSTFLVLMTSAFILINPERIINFLRSLVPVRHHGTFNDLMRRLDRGLSGVVRGQLLICLINGTLTGIGIAVIGVPFVITLTFIATVFSLIPIFGVLISTIPIILIALTVSFSTALLALGWILIVHFLEGNFLNPKIMGDSSHIHPALIIFALVVGQYLGGIMGALLAVPVFSLVQNSFLFLKSLAEQVEPAA
ncbi:MAG: AI-2E family transporter [SAR324 cluster bacterium]|nr:AI-2E family transporter [SAR324 cluster bacterium]